MRETPIAIVVAAGPAPGAEPAREAVQQLADALVIAADGGLERCGALGLAPDIVIGDFDSATPAELARAEAGGAEVIRHPARKDATDLELALDLALERGARRVLVVASSAGRFDHLISSTVLLASPRYAALELDAYLGAALVHVIRDERELTATVGELLTLVPLGGDAEGVTTSGLEYALRGERLQAGTTRGVSNVVVAPLVRVALDAGTLLAVRPNPGEHA